MVKIQLIEEYKIDSDTNNEIANLVQKTFADVDFKGRTYYKQIPHFRFLAFRQEKLLGHLGVDYRVMSLDGIAIKIFGVYDLCVDKEAQGQGISKLLMHTMEGLAKEFNQNVDFLFLATDLPYYYEKMGFQKIDCTISWLKINQLQNLGVGKEQIKDTSFMIKSVGEKKWVNGHLDMLGYMY